MATNGNGHTQTLGRRGAVFTAEDVTNLAQLSAFVAQACASAGDPDAGLTAADILGELARRIAASLPLQEQLRLTPPPLRIAEDRDRG